MPDMTYMQSDALQQFADSLELFMAKINSRCNDMEQGISESSLYMQDDVSKKALSDASLLCAEIRALLNPAKLVLEKVLGMIDTMKQGDAELSF